ncbi:lipase class 3 [Fusarium mundagurra]|uniref:Lipase class 3 n=1 Tax=Fusarium mundagurra TaxID=1567541 RepID=A0A8H5XQ99_9HYPO|nr:lipase class 3 [Fusarium mundagurra]
MVDLLLASQNMHYEFRMVSLAAESAQAAYLSNSSELPDCLYELFRSVEQATPATRDGSVKASILVTTDYSDLPLLIVACRGTASLVDWLVNLDGDLEDCSNFISQRQGTSSFNVEPDIARTTAHAGLLRIAKCMASEVCNKILDAGSSRFTTTGGGRKPVLMVTGHSAGGGVASLMSSHIRLRRHDIVDRFEAVHCVTFAAPPVFDSPDTVNDVPNLPLGLSINIVNYGDIVPRADKAYIKSLLALYIERAESLIDDIWDFGEPIAWNYGQNVLLMDVAPIDADAQNADGDDGTDIKAFSPDMEDACFWKCEITSNGRMYEGNKMPESLNLGVSEFETRLN